MLSLLGIRRAGPESDTFARWDTMNRLNLRSVALTCLLALSVLIPNRGLAAGTERDWMDGFALVVLDTDDIDSLHRARRTVQAYGGWIALLSPPSLLMGWIPQEVAAELEGKDNIRSIHYDAVDPDISVSKQPGTDYMLRSFNDIVSGRYNEQIAAATKQGEKPTWPYTGEGDGFAAEDFDYEEYLNNLIRQGLDPAKLKEQGILVAPPDSEKKNESDAMSGTVSLTIFFAESDGSGTDPNAYTWDPQDVQDYINGVNVGLAWWSSIARSFNNCWVGFMVRHEPPTNPNCSQPIEIVLHNSSSVGTMVDNVMTNFGYVGSHFSQTQAYNTWQVSTYGTDRAYCAFVGYNEGGPSQLTDGRAAFAYLMGPYTFLLFNSYSWRPDQVFTHETGHIFGACDEYADSGCTCASGCSNGFSIGNCENGACFNPCMMANNDFLICNFTDGHIGWRFSPCAPPALTPPTIDSLDPPAVKVGTTVDITVHGSDLLFGAFIELGPNTTQNSTTYVDANTVVVNVTIDEIADPGPRDAEILNRDLQSDVLTDGLQLIPTSRHYVDPLGSATFPYTTRMTAANSLSQVFTAIGAGDSVLVVSGTFNPGTVQLTRPMKVYGGWSADFTSRDLVSSKTVLSIGENLQLKGDVLIDGFILQNGIGRNEVDPLTGLFGGAISVRLTAATIANCEFRNNSATGSGVTHGGGAIYVKNGALNLVNNDFHDNQSFLGGAIYMYQSSGNFTGNIFHDNLVNAGGAAARAGAIYLAQCSDVTLEDNVFDNNTGADKGGAIYIANSINVIVRGGSTLNTSSTTEGGAIYAIDSSLSVEGVFFDAPSTTSFGGAISVTNASSCAISGNRFVGAAANLGGAVALTTSSADLRHNLFTGNAAVFIGSAVYASGVSGGSFFGNTIADNGGSGAAAFFSNSNLTVSNNIVANHAGVGLSCGGAPIPVFSYNDVFATAGGPYQTCVPGVGSISADPIFVDTVGGDYHLALHSGALDAGDPNVALVDPDGGRGDLGWYGSHSFASDAPSYPQTPSVQTVGGSIVVNWSPNPEGDVVQYVVYGSPTSDFKPTAALMRATVAAPATTSNLGPANGDQYFKLCAVDGDGYSSGFSAEVQADATGTGTPIYRTRLLGNKPNPFNPSTLIQYEIAYGGRVRLRIYDVAGRLVRDLVDAELDAGRHDAVWNGRGQEGIRVASGSYFYRLEAGSETHTGKMVLVK